MLSRSLSDASNLKRSKSSSSVKQRRTVPLVLDIVDPETARQHALAAANAAMGRAQERASAESRRSAELARANSATSKGNSAATPNSQTIRFTGATELRRKRSILRQRAPSLASPPHLPDHGLQANLTAVPSISEFGVPTGYGSTPSSYRRLRKAKSMLTPRRRAMSVQSFTQSPRTLRQTHHTTGDTGVGFKLGLRRSISFLKGASNSQARTMPSTEAHDAAIQLARDQFVQDLEVQNLKARPNFFVSSKVKRQQKAFRKTVRSNRKTEFGDPIASENQISALPEQQTKQRSFSLSLKQTVRRLCGRSPSARHNIPAQHLDASRSHFRDYIDSTGGNPNHEYFYDYPPDSTSRGSDYVLSANGLDPAEDYQNLPLSLMSKDSTENLANTRSRVSSWTDSTFTNSEAPRPPVEKKRLSIIQEHGGPHQPSSSAGRHVDGIAVFRQPLRNQNSYGQPSPPADSQRLYSALMKRIDESERDEQKSQTDYTPVRESKTAEPGCSSFQQTFKTAPTIRAVKSDFSLRSISKGQISAYTNTSQELSYSADESGPTPPKPVKRSVGGRKKGSMLQEAKSSFFPFSNEEKPETPSPFSIVLAARRGDYSSSEEEVGSVVHHQAPYLTSSTTCSESVYSRTTDGHTPNFSHANQSHEEYQPAGMATIMPDAGGKYSRPISSLVQAHEQPTNSSTEWRSWMTSQIASIDRRNLRKGKGNEDQTHHRENAQIDGDDTAIGRMTFNLSRQASDFKPADPRPELQCRPSRTTDRFPLLEVREDCRNNVPEHRRSSSQTRKVHQLSHHSSTINDENARLPGTGSTAKNKASTFRLRPSQISFTSLKKDAETITPPEIKQRKSAFSLLGVGDSTPTPKRYLSRLRANTATHNHYGPIEQLQPPSAMKNGSESGSGSGHSSPAVQHLARLSRPFDGSHAWYSRPMTMAPDIGFANVKKDMFAFWEGLQHQGR